MSDAANLLAKLTANDSGVRTLRATVSAYREDGMVNLRYGTAQIFGVPCLASYTNRRIGDVVQVLDLGRNAWLVVGRIGGTDSSWLAPVTQNTGWAVYDMKTMRARGSSDPGYEGYVGVTDAPGDSPGMLAWSYYNGTTNALPANGTTKTSMTVTVARNSVLHGQREAVELQLCPHNFNALPTVLTLGTNSFSPVFFRLEVGEVRTIPIPADWWTAITAVTPTIKGFAIQPTTLTTANASYVIFSKVSGGFRAI
jgi:hypothetical protein